MNCPKCDGTLGRVTVTARPEYGKGVLQTSGNAKNIEVDQCLSCNGIWFDVGELDQYLSGKLIILNSPSVKEHKVLSKKKGDCPRCRQPMTQKPSSVNPKVTMDVCSSCQGVWLDSSEIDRLEKVSLTGQELRAIAFAGLKLLFRS